MLDSFEDELLKLIEKIELKNKNYEFQRKLKKVVQDIKKV